MRFSKLKIIRCCKKVDGFCVLPQSTIGDRNLSLRSYGILFRILSLENGDDFTISGFSKDDGVDIKSLRTVLKELEKNGYYKKEIATNEKGREIGVYHTFFDSPNSDCNIVQIRTTKEKPFPHTPYKKKDKEEYISFSKPNIDILDSENNNIDINNFSFVSSTREEEKEKKEKFPIFEKDIFEEFFTNTIYREGMMKIFGLSEKALDYCIRNARKSASCFIDGITRRDAQVYIKNELVKIPPLKGGLKERNKKFFNEVLRCAMALNIDEEFAVSFYSNWSQLAIPELEVMRFENERHNNAWDTTRRLKIAHTSYLKKNEKYY